VLIYAFDLLELFPKITILNEEISEGFIVLFLTACLATGGLVIAGYIIDRKPKFARHLITGSLVINGFCLYLIVLGIDSIIYIVVGLPILGFFLGILASVSGAVYAAYSDIENRGKNYAFALFLATIFAVIIIPTVEILNSDLRTPLFLIGSFSLVCGLFYPFFSKMDKAWHNDPFPTPIRDIINRKPVQAYLLAHFFIYLMLGIAFTTISQEEDARLFWFSVFLGDMCFVLPMGWLSDRLGRKDLIVVGAYGIVISSLIVGLTDNNLLYYFAAFLLGVSFASMHVSIDSAVWSDLSPLDSIGRYYALGFIFLLQGVGVGLLIGIVIPFSDLSTVSYILIAMAIVALLPLFFVSDSFEPLDLFLLLVSMSGMLFFDYDFKHKEKISEKDLTLVTGALSAISMFFEGVDEQHKALDLVQHGNVFIVQTVVHAKKGDIIATLFANKASTELQNKLDEFITNFCNKFEKEISEWIGQPSVFIKGFEVAEAVFGPLIPAKTIFRDLNAKNVLRKHKD
jgi:MFS family permease